MASFPVSLFPPPHTPSSLFSVKSVIFLKINSSVNCILKIPQLPPSLISGNSPTLLDISTLNPLALEYVHSLFNSILAQRHSFLCPVCPCPTSLPGRLPLALQGSIQSALPLGHFLWMELASSSSALSLPCTYLSVAFITLSYDFTFSCVYLFFQKAFFIPLYSELSKFKV